MSQILSLKKRIKNLGNIHKMMQALQIITASRIRRAKELFVDSTTFMSELELFIAKLSLIIDSSYIEKKFPDIENPQVLIIAITSDQGYCGDFNRQVMERLQKSLKLFPKSEILMVGEKAGEYARHLKIPVAKSFKGASDKNILELSKKLFLSSQAFMHKHPSGKVYIVYNKFQSVLVQQPKIREIYPSTLSIGRTRNLPIENMIIEPKAEKLFDEAADKFLFHQLHKTLAESLVGELGSRLIMVKGAAETSKKLMQEVKLQFHKERQSHITRELLDIVSTFEALKEAN